MLSIQQLLNVVANTPVATPVTVEFNGVSYPLGAAEIRGGALVLQAHSSDPVPSKRPGKSKPATTPEPAAPSEANSGEGMELK